MKSSNRFLLGFGIVIGVLVIAAVVLALSAHSSDSFLAEDTPGGTVQRFLVALQDNDLQKAHSYMSLDGNGENMYQQWLTYSYPQSFRSAWKATLGDINVNDGTANVVVTVDTLLPDVSLINPVSSEQILFQLTKIGNSWFINSPPNLYWLY